MGTQLWKIFRGALIAGAGAGLTYLTEAIGSVDFGTWTPMVVAAMSVLVNIIRKVLAAWGAKVATGALVILALSLPASAQNLASKWSWGPSIPMTKFPLSGGQNSYLPAGLGVGPYRNFKMNDSGSISWLTIGLPFYLQGTSDPGTFSLSLGPTLGTLNNLIAAGFIADFVKSIDGASPSGFFDGIDKEDFAFVVAFNLNLGGGEPASLSRRAGAIISGQGEHVGPPPNYWRLW